MLPANPHEIWTGLAAKAGLQGDQPIALAAVATLLLVLITTRLTTGRALVVADGRSLDSRKGIIPPVLGHWIPFIGKTTSMALNKDSFLQGMRKHVIGITNFTMMGTSHYFVYKPSMWPSFYNLFKDEGDDNPLWKSVLLGAFGLPALDYERYHHVLTEARRMYKHLNTEPGLGNMTKGTVSTLRREIPNFVTFNAYPADQAGWERLAEAELIEDIDGKGTQAVEVELMQLVREFIAKTAMPSLFGSDLFENFPDIFEHNWVFDDGFVPLAMGFPRWIPYRPVQRALAARERILSYMREFHVAMEKRLNGEDPGPRWQRLDDVGTMVMERCKMYHQVGNISIDGRAVLDLGLMWTSTANSNPTTMWMLYEVVQDPELLAQIREEVAPFLRAVQPPNDFGPAVWVPPELESVDIDGLTSRCPLLKAAYVETMRIYMAPWSLTKLAHDAVIEDRVKDPHGGGGMIKQTYLLKQGSYAHMPVEMHHSDPEAFPNPQEFRVDRHLSERTNEKGEKVLTADMGTVRPYGGGDHMCKGRTFAMREMLLYTAVIITFFDILPVKGQPWPKPKLRRTAAASFPTKPLRVWIKKRKIEAKP